MSAAIDAVNAKPCETCGRELWFYTLRMDARPVPAGPVYCQAHDPKWAPKR